MTLATLCLLVIAIRIVVLGRECFFLPFIASERHGPERPFDVQLSVVKTLQISHCFTCF